MDTDWSDDIELIINKIRINSLKLAEYHRRTYLDLKNKIDLEQMLLNLYYLL